MATKKKRFSPPYLAIEDYNGRGVLYSNKGEYSVVMEVTNPVRKYSSDTSAYYEASATMTNLLKTLGSGYAVQKHDIFSRTPFDAPKEADSYLERRYFDYFKGRIYTAHRSFLTITQEKGKGFLNFSSSRWKEFFERIDKVIDLLTGSGWHPHVLAKDELSLLLHRYFAINFRSDVVSLDNFKASNTQLSIGGRIVRTTSLVDIDEMDMPAQLYPVSVSNLNGTDYTEDLVSFLSEFEDADDLIYHQLIIIPNQKLEASRLTTKRNRHRSLPSAANMSAEADILAVEQDVEQNNKLYVYAHYSIITAGEGSKVGKTINLFESLFAKRGIRLSRSSYNQLELFLASMPGCGYWTNPSYDRFLTLHDVVGCLIYKEREEYDEDTPLKIYYTNRAGIPKAIDITGKEGKHKLTTNSNFFCLGPSGSGKSFHMNGVVRQLYEQDTDIVLVDTGHSYEGLCNYVGGKYISYKEDKPISMNPFKIGREELNLEKINFLKSLVFVIWKGMNGTVTNAEDEFMERVLSAYYKHYFDPFERYSEAEYAQRKQILMLEMRNQRKSKIADNAERIRLQERREKIKILAERAVGAEQEAAIQKLELFDDTYDLDVEREIEALIKYEIDQEEKILREMHVTELSFNSFFEFSLEYIPFMASNEHIDFDIDMYRFLLSKFYKGGSQERTLNEDMDTTLFDERFIVFEIDAIKDDPKLFPIVTLIIMDVFLQKMRLKKNRKALIIEEAWKALASDMMAEYIKYLYKTVRKFWGIVGVVTQEVEDIISSAVVKNAILNNSEITILLDQAKLKDRFDDIKGLLGLTDQECAKIWTINNLNNTAGRGAFKEVYIRRGSYGEVYGVEESPQSYMAYTTERVEKDALMYYFHRTGNIEQAIEQFVIDWKASGIKKIMDFAKTVGK